MEKDSVLAVLTQFYEVYVDFHSHNDLNSWSPHQHVYFCRYVIQCKIGPDNKCSIRPVRIIKQTSKKLNDWEICLFCINMAWQ